MSRLVPYLHFDRTAEAALTRYQEIFGGELQLFTFEQFSRDDGPADAIAHGMLTGEVEIFAADVAGEERPLALQGILFSLLGTADPATLHRWFDELAVGGTVKDPLQTRPWGDVDGTVEDRFGVTWLIGYQPES